MRYFNDAQLIELSAEFPRMTVLRDLGRGTAFPATADLPGGLQANDRFYRTDIGWLCYYDGTRWLTVHEYAISSGLRTTVGAGTFVIGPLRQDYVSYFTRITRLINTGATNTGANYWTITVLGANAAQSSTSSIDVATTAAIAGSTWATNDSAPSATALPANNNGLDFSCVATGAPSSLGSLVLTVYFRLVIT
jgi:hypothetical protein